MPGILNGGSVTFAYADFDAGLNFTAVTALQLSLTPTSAPVNCSVGAVATGPVPLIFMDGFESGNTSAWSTTVP